MSTTKTNTAYSALIPGVLGLAIFAWSALFVWQGLDFTDMGFLLVTYQQFYSAPETNVYFLLNWLTAFIGHWMGEPFGGSVVVYKLGAAVILALTGVIAYLGLSAVLGRRGMLAVFIFVTFLFATKASDNWISYNNLTGLFYVLGGVLLFLGLQRERRAWVLLAGVILGANLFIRFPNLLGIGLVLGVVLHGLLQRWPRRQTLGWSARFLLGWLLGVAAIALLIVAHGHADYYLQSLAGIFGKAADESSTHSGSMLLKLLVRDHAYALVLATLVVGASVIVLRLGATRSRGIQVAVTLASALILAIAFKRLESWQWAVPGLLYFGLLWIALQEWHSRPWLVVLAFIALAILVIAPLGSNNGMRNAIHGSWLALPLVLTWLWQRAAGAQAALPLVPGPAAGRLAAATLAIALVGFSLVTAWFYSYRDSSNRLALTHPVAHPLLHGTYTTEARARVVSELVGELPNWVEPGDSLLAYPDLPTVHYLTETTTWLQNPWPILQRGPQLTARLEEATSETLPVVVRSIGVTRNFTWPIDSPRDESPDREAAWSAFDRFVERAGYERVWANGFFEIFVPR
ncbi:MAG: hypothetical protein EOM24_00670 [Chloroflexia bacterium]|nr:hypothetical protein [Chloroflexia bacterium]